MKTTTDNHIDKLLHEAMKQRAAKVPPLADDFAEKVLQRTPLRLPRVGEKKTIPLRRWWLPISVAASIVIAFLLWPNSPAVIDDTPVVAEVVEQPVLKAPKASECSDVPEASDKPEPAKSTNSSRTYKPHRVSKPIEESLLAEVETDEDMEDPFLAIAEQMQDIRLRGEQVRHEVAQLIDKQANLQ
jgi:hypothetical protein